MTKRTFLFFAMRLLFVGMPACDQTVGLGEFVNNGLDAADEEGLTTNEYQAISSEKLVATWATEGKEEKETFIFERDGQGSYRVGYVSDSSAAYGPQPVRWEQRGNVLATITTEEASTYTWEYSQVSTIALTGNELTFRALIRTDGAGSGYDGIWKNFTSEREVYDSGAADFYDEKRTSILTMTISGASVTGSIRTFGSMSGDYIDYEESDEDGVYQTDWDNVDTFVGTIMEQDAYVVIERDDGDYFTLEYIQDGVMKLASGEPERAADEWLETIFYRQ